MPLVNVGLGLTLGFPWLQYYTRHGLIFNRHRLIQKRVRRMSAKPGRSALGVALVVPNRFRPRASAGSIDVVDGPARLV